METTYEERWESLISLSGMNIKELSDFLNVTRSHIYDIKNGKANPSSKVLQKLGELDTPDGRINLHWLLLGEGEMFLRENDDKETFDTTVAYDLISRETSHMLDTIKELKAKYESLHTLSERMDKLEQRVGQPSTSTLDFLSEKDLIKRAETKPSARDHIGEESVLDYTRAAAGQPIPIGEAAEKIRIRGKYNNAEYFVARAHGTSMVSAGINDGDLVLIKRSDTPLDGEIMYCYHDGSATIKKLKCVYSAQDPEQECPTWQLHWCDSSGYIEEITDEDWRVYGLFAGKAQEIG